MMNLSNTGISISNNGTGLNITGNYITPMGCGPPVGYSHGSTVPFKNKLETFTFESKDMKIHITAEDWREAMEVFIKDHLTVRKDLADYILKNVKVKDSVGKKVFPRY